MNINKVEQVINSLFGTCVTRARVFVLMLLSSIVILLPTVVQADMVFDFQMKLAQKGNAEAQFKVGEMYETGFGVKQDSAQAMEWVTKAASKGNETAGFKLLYWDVEKNGMTNANKINLGSLKAKVKQGNPQASYYLGKMYARGVGFPRNTNKAIKLLNKAASIGVPAAETELAMVRERRQSQQAAKRRIDEKKRADFRAKQEREKQARLEERRKLKAQKQAQRLAAEKAQIEAMAKQNAGAEKRKHEIALANEKSSREKLVRDKLVREKAAEEKRLFAVKQAKQRQAQIAARKKAMIKKREEAAASQKASFESDPCSGKSARFLSTCR